MKILTLIADADEYEPFKSSIKNRLTEEFSFYGMPGLKFTYKSFDVTVICFGIGKVHAATGTALSLSNKKYDLVINTGWSGAVSGVRKGNIVAGSRFYECDFDLSTIGYRPGLKPYHKEAGNICNNIYFKKLTDSGLFMPAVLGTGDIFLSDKVLAEKYKEIFNINAFDMESAAIAEVCALFNVPFLSIRKISDNADDAAPDTYRETLNGNDTAFSEIIAAALDKIAEE